MAKIRKTFKRTAEVVKRNRIRRGITQTELAQEVAKFEEIDFTRGLAQTISNIERGVQSISVDTIYGFCRALGVDWHVIIDAKMQDEEHYLRNVLQKKVIKEMEGAAHREESVWDEAATSTLQ